MVKLNEVLFSDIYITPDKIAYIPDNVTPNGLEVLEAEDFDDFFDLIEQTWDGNNTSNSVMFDEIFYRVERTVSIYGIQYCARKMPKQVPPFNSLGYPVELSQYLLSLSNASGLILCAGPTGAGKTTTISKTRLKCRWTAFIIRLREVWACASKRCRRTATGARA